jgi:hypothetical protein
MLVLDRLRQQMCSYLAVDSAEVVVHLRHLPPIGVALVVLAVVVSLVLRSLLLLGHLFR